MKTAGTAVADGLFTSLSFAETALTVIDMWHLHIQADPRSLKYLHYFVKLHIAHFPFHILLYYMCENKIHIRKNKEKSAQVLSFTN